MMFYPKNPLFFFLDLEYMMFLTLCFLSLGVLQYMMSSTSCFQRGIHHVLHVVLDISDSQHDVLHHVFHMFLIASNHKKHDVLHNSPKKTLDNANSQHDVFLHVFFCKT